MGDYRQYAHCDEALFNISNGKRMAFVCTKEIDIKNVDSVRSGSELVGRLFAASFVCVCHCL